MTTGVGVGVGGDPVDGVKGERNGSDAVDV